MASVKGIGGVFINSLDSTQLAAWYRDILGIEMEAHPQGKGYFHVFWTKDAESGVLRENPVFAINQLEEGAQKPVPGGFVLNLRVDDLAAYLELLHSKGVQDEGRVQEWERGKHAWIKDPEGNQVELYEEISPADSGEEV
jgi:catechol 2,3-dioxygenase-like lactoylglutathione lyase family enzyme